MTKIWAYVKEHNLPKAGNKKKYQLDAVLQKALGRKTLDFQSLSRAIASQIKPTYKYEEADAVAEEDAAAPEAKKNVAAAKRKAAAATGRARGGFGKELPLSPALSAFLGCAKASRTYVRAVLMAHLKRLTALVRSPRSSGSTSTSTGCRTRRTGASFCSTRRSRPSSMWSVCLSGSIYSATVDNASE